MEEFWESSFREKQTMWGFEPSDSAIFACDFFEKKQLKDILIPGIGYGRNAKIFQDHGMNVTGIEISETAINLARTYYGTDMNIFHGSVTDMPFDDKQYDGIFCYALIHLLNCRERRKLIRDCYNQLKQGGYMIFIAVSTKAPMYGGGKLISKNRFELMKGVKMFFYEADSVQNEFGKYGLETVAEIDEPIKNMERKPPLKFYVVTCTKQ